jgi:23S rRNA pseudouridine2605 synthase
MKTMRLNKFLSESGISSRRKVEELILMGRVSINDEVVKNLAVKVDPEVDMVSLDGEKLKLQKKVYFLMNKPKGYVSTTSDEKNRNAVVDLIKTDMKIFPVGRLDFNTTGVLLLTNDGDFTNFLLHPNNRIPRIYRVALDKPLSNDDILKLKKGLIIDGKKGKFEEIRIQNNKSKKIATIKTVEGRNHFVKNMFKALGYKVNKLSRISFGGIGVGKLILGSYRELSREEISNVYKKYAHN